MNVTSVDILVESLVREYLTRSDGENMKQMKQIFEKEKVHMLLLLYIHTQCC